MDDLIFFNGIIPYLVMLYLSMSIISYITDFGVKNFSLKDLGKHLIKAGVFASIVEYKKNRKLAEFVVGTVVAFVVVAFLMAILSMGLGFLYEYRGIVITLVLVGVGLGCYYYFNIVTDVQKNQKEAHDFGLALIDWLSQQETGMSQLVPNNLMGVYVSPMSDGKKVCIYELHISLSRYDFDENVQYILENHVNSVCRMYYARWMPDAMNAKMKFVNVRYVQQMLCVTIACMDNAETYEVVKRNVMFSGGHLESKQENPIDPNFG